jgi:hypothetical protein
MHRSTTLSVAAVAAASLSMIGQLAFAQTPAPIPAPTPAPVTFWNRLGIPSHPLDAVRNRGGNFPESERKPRLKPIADPANLASSNPAIQKAAEIKAQEDAAAQKIKAIKYLGEIGCGGCYKGVDKALAEALGDCTEAVRYEAVKAVLSASACGENECIKKCVRQTKTCKEATCDCWVGCMKRTCATMHLLCGKALPDGTTLKSKCPGYGCGAGGNCPGSRCACGDGNCCTSEILNKLSTMAFEKDDRGCWKEPSPRVRALARQALRACRPNIRPMTDADIPVPEEVPLNIEAVPTAPTPKPEQVKPVKPEPREEVKPEPRANDGAAIHGHPLTTAIVGEDRVVDIQVAEQQDEPGQDETTAIEAELPASDTAAVADSDADLAASAPAEIATAETAPIAIVAEPTGVLVSLEIPMAPSPEELLHEPTVNPRPATAHTHRHQSQNPQPTAAKNGLFQFMRRR